MLNFGFYYLSVFFRSDDSSLLLSLLIPALLWSSVFYCDSLLMANACKQFYKYLSSFYSSWFLLYLAISVHSIFLPIIYYEKIQTDKKSFYIEHLYNHHPYFTINILLHICPFGPSISIYHYLIFYAFVSFFPTSSSRDFIFSLFIHLNNLTSESLSDCSIFCYYWDLISVVCAVSFLVNCSLLFCNCIVNLFSFS